MVRSRRREAVGGRVGVGLTAVLLGSVALPRAAYATDYVVTGAPGFTLNDAIAKVDAGSGGDRIILQTPVVMLNSDPLALTKSVTIVGNGNTIDGQGLYRGLLAYSGTISIQNLTIFNTTATGGAGGSGGSAGGGGMGAGAGLFVASGANVTLSGVRFDTNAVVGGAGGTSTTGTGGGPYGGGGGLGGAGGSPTDPAAAGGGGGVGSNAVGASDTAQSAQGIVPGSGGADGQTQILGILGNTNANPAGSPNGGGGGAGGATDIPFNNPGQGGGGGVGATGINGGFGGGGGGNSDTSATVNTGNGGNGGFGGGGGGGFNLGGAGGFGGGAGGGANAGAGFGGGADLPMSAGGPLYGGNAGAGAGFGGAIFVQQGGVLIVTGNSSQSAGSVTAGTNAAVASPSILDGQAGGAGIFLQGAGNVIFTPAAGQTVTLADTITDEVGFLAANPGYTAPAGSTSPNNLYSLTMNGPGTLVLQGANQYSGGTFLNAGIVSVATDANLGTATGGLTFAGGTLEATAGGFASARAVTLNAGGGTVQVDVGTSTLSGTVGGVGGLAKTGPGTLVLSGTDTYSGPTAVNAGTLAAGSTTGLSPASAFAVNAGATLSLAGFSSTIGSLADGPGGSGIVNNGGATPVVLSLGGNGTSTTFSGTIQDGGAAALGLVKQGSGVFTLLGADTYSGGTTIGAGTLQLGNGGTTGSIVGSVVDNANLAFNRSNTYTFGGTISGTGAVQQVGTGTTILTADNIYSGGTTIAAGTLQLGNGGTTGSIVGSVVDNANLVFNRSNTYTFGGAISGTGSVQQVGIGTTVLAADSTYSGGTTINAGTLQLGDGGTTGSIVGSVVDNANLVFNRSNAYSFSGTISGTGSVQQAGAGTTIFTTGNTYSGGTTITAGALQLGNGGTTGSIVGNVIDNANLVFDRTDTVIFPGTISGSGGVAQIGTGTVVLTAADTYTGGTTIGAGTLQIGNGGAAGSIIGNIVDNSALVLNRTGTLMLPGNISGTGALAQIGSGTSVLAGANSYTGTTLVGAGTLQGGSASGFSPNSAFIVAAGATLDLGGFNETVGSLAGAGIVRNSGSPTAILTAGGNNASTVFSGVIEDDGPTGLTKIGTGTMTLSGVETYSGPTTVLGGVLLITGSAANSTVTASSGGALAGGGTVGALVVQGGGTVAPGLATPYSTLRVVGPVTFQSNSTYAVNIAASGQTDSIAAGTSATLTGGTVGVTVAPGTYGAFQRFTILTAPGGVSGRFAGLTINGRLPTFTFLTVALGYDPTDVYLGFSRNKVGFASVAETPNQRATAAAVDRLPANNRIFKAVVSGTPAGARAAFDALSGEIHASAVSAVFQDTRLPREAILDRLAEPYGAATPQTSPDVSPGGFSALYTKEGVVLPAPAKPSVYTAWGQGFGDFGQIGGNGNAATVQRSMGGLVAGVDVSPDSRWRVGFAGGYTQSILTDGARGSSGNIQSEFGGLYGGAALNNWRIRGGALVGHNDYDLRRSVAFPGFTDKTRSQSGGYTAQAFGEVGYRSVFGRLAVEPFVGALAMHIDTESFRESGGAAALIGLGRGYDYGATTLGVRADATLTTFGALPLSAHGALAWQHVFGAVTPASILAFASTPTNTFTVAGAPIARDAAIIEAGVDWRLAANTTAGVFYSGSLADKTYDNAVKGKLEVRF